MEPQPDLSDREIEIIQGLSKGKTLEEIAVILCISECTVKSHLKNILEKFHVKNAAEIIAIGNQLRYSI